MCQFIIDIFGCEGVTYVAKKLLNGTKAFVTLIESRK